MSRGLPTMLKWVSGVSSTIGGGMFLWASKAPEDTWWVIGILFATLVLDFVFESLRSIKEHKFQWYATWELAWFKPVLYGGVLWFCVLVGLAIDELAFDTKFTFVYRLPIYIGTGLIVKEFLSTLAHLNALTGGKLEVGVLRRFIEFIELARSGMLNEQQLTSKARDLARCGVQSDDVHMVVMSDSSMDKPAKSRKQS